MGKNPFNDYRKQNYMFTPGFQFEYPYLTTEGYRIIIHVTYAKLKGNRIAVKTWLSVTTADETMRHTCSIKLIELTCNLAKRNMSANEIRDSIFSNIICNLDFHYDVITAVTRLYGIDVAEIDEDQEVHVLSRNFHQIELSVGKPVDGCLPNDLMYNICYGGGSEGDSILYDFYVVHKDNPARILLLSGELMEFPYDANDPDNIQLVTEAIMFTVYNQRHQQAYEILTSIMPEYLAGIKANQEKDKDLPDLNDMLMTPADVTIVRGKDGSHTIIAPKGLDDDTEEVANNVIAFMNSLLDDSSEEDE